MTEVGRHFFSRALEAVRDPILRYSLVAGLRGNEPQWLGS
jgi:hypothetical protein